MVRPLTAFSLVARSRVQWFLFISPDAGWHVYWTSGLAAATIIISFIGSVLLFCVLISRRQHEMLLLSLVPKAVVERVWHDNMTMEALISSGTPAEKMLEMMSQLLRGLTPSIQDVILVRTALLQSFDLYTPIGMEERIRDVVSDVSTIPCLCDINNYLSKQSSSDKVALSWSHAGGCGRISYGARW